MFSWFRKKTKRYRYQVNVDTLLTYNQALELMKKRYAAHKVMGGNIKAFLDKDKENIIHALGMKGITAEPFHVDRQMLEGYMLKAGYKEHYPDYYQDNIYEKALEHFIAYRLLDLRSDDVFMDIASEHSPLSDIFERLCGSQCYRQDIMYEPGIHGSRIGSDVADIPVDDGFFSKAAATCSIEHFEGDGDIRFIKEMQRILNKKGRLVIVPLYIYPDAYTISDPLHAIQADVEFDPGVQVIGVEAWNNRHGRFYSPETLVERLIANAPQFDFRVYVLDNPGAIHSSLYCHFILYAENKQT